MTTEKWTKRNTKMYMCKYWNYYLCLRFEIHNTYYTYLDFEGKLCPHESENHNRCFKLYMEGFILYSKNFFLLKNNFISKTHRYIILTISRYWTMKSETVHFDASSQSWINFEPRMTKTNFFLVLFETCSMPTTFWKK